MEVQFLSMIGGLASITSIILFLPQFWKIWKLRHDHQALRGVPTSRMLILWIQALLWITYGIALEQFWVSVPGIINTPFMVASILIVMRAHKKSKEKTLSL